MKQPHQESEGGPLFNVADLELLHYFIEGVPPKERRAAGKLLRNLMGRLEQWIEDESSGTSVSSRVSGHTESYE